MLLTLVPQVNAQRIGGSSSRFAAGFNRAHHSRTSFYPLAFSDPFYSDYLSAIGYPVASQPPIIMMQAPQASAPAPDRFSQPLMIELQGDRYVQVSGSQASGAEMIPPTQENGKKKANDRNAIDLAQNSPARRQGTSVRTVPAPELQPAVLVFRDGHNEEASDYTIADGILYARADPYTGGSWNRKIALSSLNLPETIASSKSRGVRFELPTAPNEVIVRP